MTLLLRVFGEVQDFKVSQVKEFVEMKIDLSHHQVFITVSQTKVLQIYAVLLFAITLENPKQFRLNTIFTDWLETGCPCIHTYFSRRRRSEKILREGTIIKVNPSKLVSIVTPKWHWVPCKFYRLEAKWRPNHAQWRLIQEFHRFLGVFNSHKHLLNESAVTGVNKVLPF